MSHFRFDTYYRYEQLVTQLQNYAALYPTLMKLVTVGKSYEGRDLIVAIITNFNTGCDMDKPGFWIDGNIHAVELAGSSACTYLIHTFLTEYGSHPDITRCLDRRTFYICPRVNPDGAEWALATPPRFIRSSTRPYPYCEEPIGGLAPQDIDGDGRVLMMRIKDPDGPWRVSAIEPRLLVPREPTEVGGNYYRLLPEGYFDDYDSALLTLQPRKERLDLNRNFPAEWQEEGQQPGSGPYPTSEPEVRAIVDFISQHKNICGGVNFHTYSGVLLRPYSFRSDDDLPPEDLWTFQKIGAKGQELTGYPHISAYEGFRYHPKEYITGACDDWLYDHIGVFAWTVEIWSPQRQAGIAAYKFIDWYRDHPFDDDLKLLHWSDSKLGGKGYIDWYPYQHPQLGPIEIGGWDFLYSFWNPPPALLEDEIKRFPDWILWHHLISPQLEIHEIQVLRLAPETFHIKLIVKNTGWLPTYVTKKALEKKRLRGVVCELELAADMQLLSGRRRVELSELEGRAYKNSAPISFGANAADPTAERIKAEWLVKAPAGGVVTVVAKHDRAGTVRQEIRLSTV